MKQSTHFFAEFPAISKEQWLERITKDLKGKPLDELRWQLREDLEIDPFVHADDQNIPPVPLQTSANGWQISELIEDPIAPTANRQALEALAFGAESLHFQLQTPHAASEIGMLLDRIQLEFISLQFSGPGVEHSPAAVLSALGGLAKQQGIVQKNLNGALFYDPVAASGRIQDWRYLIDLLDYAHAEIPGFRCITVDGRPAYQGTESVVEELAAMIHQGAQYLKQLHERGMPPDRVAAQIQFCGYIGKSYFVEIAKLRALQLLWLNVLKAWKLEPTLPVLDVHFSPSAYTDALYTNMISATTMAMSAVIGGANRLTVLPYDAGREDQAQYPRSFSRRIARNVQQLLQLESGFGALADPAAGSYYLEKLTNQLAEAAWAKLDL